MGQEDGAVLIGAIVVALILSMLGMVSLHLATQEVESVKAAKEEAAVQYLAEAGVDLAVQFFHDPSSLPSDATGNLFQKRFELAEAGPSFFDVNGASQFRGTAASPDLSYDAAVPVHDRLMHDPAVGWFRSLRTLGRILKLRVYGPTRPGLLCTVEVTAAGATGLTRTISVQLGARTIPPIRAGVQVGGSGVDPIHNRPLPIWLHWGDLKVKGDARLDTIPDLPIKTVLAPVSAQSYGDTSRREDRWLDVYIGGQVSFVPSPFVAPVAPPSNIHAGQEPFPGLKEDQWDYENMKKHALIYGEYYARDQDGFLYRNGRIEPGLGVTADSVFRSAAVGDHRGVVFIDTLDRRAPRLDNLGMLSVETEYAEGLFVVNANLRLKPKGAGMSLPALSPPNEGTTSLGTRVPMELNGAHVRGVLSVAGDLTLDGRSRVYGALMTGGRVIADGVTAGLIELWYDYELRQGLVRGVPLVFVAPGTWTEKL